MRIALFGSTGRVGSLMLERLVEQGHEVTVLVRNAEKLKSHERVTIIEGDAKNSQDVHTTIQGVDLVASALGTDKTTTLRESVPHMITAMKAEEISRILVIGTAGILQSRIDSSQLRYQAGDSNRKLTTAAEEHHAAYDALAESGLRWTIVCPTYLPDGPAVGEYRIEKERLPLDGKQISTADTAQFAVKELIEQQYVMQRVGIAY